MPEEVTCYAGIEIDGSRGVKMQSSNQQEEAVVRALYQQAMDGWNEGSGEAFAAPFHDEANFVAFDGPHFNVPAK
jgi:hypothetical protein